MPNEQRWVGNGVKMQHEENIFHSWNLSVFCYKKKTESSLLSVLSVHETYLSYMLQYT